MKATVVSLRGDEGVDCEISEAIKTSDEADKFGKKVAQTLVEQGAQRILDDISEKREVPETVK
jgi:hydroxymethylbilane synthase